MNLNTYPQAVLKGVFVHFLLQYNESNRESGRKVEAGFFSEVTHLQGPLLFFYSREALCGDGECYKTEAGGQVPGMHPGNFVRSCFSHLWGASHWLTGMFFTCLYRKKSSDVGEMMGDGPDGPQKSFSNHTCGILNSPDSCFLSTGSALSATTPCWPGKAEPADVNIRRLMIETKNHTL